MDYNKIENPGFETTAIHAGHSGDKETHARGIPLHRSTAYLFDSAEHAQDLFALKELGQYLYSFRESYTGCT